jgi:hypothetical protein
MVGKGLQGGAVGDQRQGLDRLEVHQQDLG